MNLLVLLLTLTTSTLVLRSGDRIKVDGPVREEGGVITFRSNGLLYSLPADEVDVEATQAADEAPPAPKVEPAKKKLRLSEEERRRLLENLEQNHGGTPPAQSAPVLYPAPTRAEIADQTGEEWSWRNQARAHEEAVRRATEELNLLESRAAQLQAEIQGFFALGYQPRQFTYQTTQLARTLERIPAARLEVERAQRALAQFRDDARRQDVMPGWLR
jgi:hypothetical protein